MTFEKIGESLETHSIHNALQDGFEMRMVGTREICYFEQVPVCTSSHGSLGDCDVTQTQKASKDTFVTVCESSSIGAKKL